MDPTISASAVSEIGQLIAELAVVAPAFAAVLVVSGLIFAGQVLQYWQSSDDQRPLLLVDDLGGYEQLLKGGRYQFGAVKH